MKYIYKTLLVQIFWTRRHRRIWIVRLFITMLTIQALR